MRHAIFSAALFAALTGAAFAQQPAFVQVAAATPQSSQTSLALPFASAETSGDLNVVVVGWNDISAAVSSVTDSLGNTYALAIGPTKASGITQSIYYAKNIIGGSNTVTVQFNQTAAYPDIRILEYSGLDKSNPLDVAQGAAGSNAAPNSGAATTTSNGDLVFGAGTTVTTFSGPGSGFSSRIITAPDGDIAEDEIVTGTGSFSASAPSSAGDWVMQMAAFRAANASGVVTSISPSSASLLSGATQQFSATVTGATDTSVTWSATGGTISTTGFFTAPTVSTFTQITVTATSNADPTSSAAASVTVHAPFAAYPVKASANQRYLIDQNNVPFLMVGDSPQALITNLSEANAAFYLTDRQTHGFNTLWVNLLCDTYTFGNANGTTYDGIAPFTTGSGPGNYDLSTPNPAYFARADAMLNMAAQNGLLVLLDPIETGGWTNTLEFNGTTKAFNYGVFVGNRYKNYPNIVWLSGNDFQNWNSSTVDNNLVKQVMAGIASVDSNHLQTIELDYDASYSDQDTALAPYLGLDLAYTYYETYDEVLQAYNSSPTRPVFMGEANYEFENNTGEDTDTPSDQRRQEYWTMTSGATGQLYGDHFTTDGSWVTNGKLDTVGVTQLQYVTALFSAYPWWNLVPDQTHAIVTAGYGTYNGSNAAIGNSNYATTAATPDGLLSITYCPAQTTLTVNMSKLSGAVIARWYDPENGTYATVAGSPFANTGTHQFATPGANSGGDSDWVLVLMVSATGKPAILTQPANQTVFTGQTATFSISASGVAPLTYQWQKNGVNISGATSSSYTTPATTAADNGSTFICVVSNSAGSTTSNAATLTVTAGVPVITSAASASPNPAEVNQSVSFNVAASDPDGDALMYAWNFGDATSGSGSSATHAYSAAGTYNASVTVSDGQGNSVSSSVTVTVTAPDTQPPTVPANLAATAVSSSQINLAWSASTDNVGVAGYTIFRGGVQIATSTANSYSNSGLMPNTTYTYTVSAFDSAGNNSAQSAPASATTQNVAVTATFIQQNSATPQSPQSVVGVTYIGAQNAGDANILAIGWNDTSASISAVTDSNGNTYQVAAATARGKGLSQAIYYAKNIKSAAAGANTVTVHFSKAAVYPDIRIFEYAGLDTSSPFDISASGSGTGASASSGAATTTSAAELIFGAGMTYGVFSAGGAGFNVRVITSPDGDIGEDKVVSVAGSYKATATNTNDNWVMQLATFKISSTAAAAAPASTEASASSATIDLGAIKLNQRFKTKLPTPGIADGAGAQHFKIARKSKLPKGVRLSGVSLGGAPKAAGTFTFGVQISSKTDSQIYVYSLTVEP